MKNWVFAFGILFCLVSCENNNKQIVQSENKVQIDSTILFDSIKIADSQKEYADTTHYFSNEQIDSVWKIAAKKLPKSDLREVSKKSFYKHYIGTLGNQKAFIDLTLMHNDFYNSYNIIGVLSIKDNQELMEILASSKSQRENIKSYIEFNATKSKIDRDFLGYFIKGYFSNDLTYFRGFAIDRKNLTVLPFDFEEDYSDGASQLETMAFEKFKKYKEQPMGNKYVRFKGIGFDSSLNTKLNMVESYGDLDEKANQWYFSNFDSAAVFTQKRFDRYVSKRIKEYGGNFDRSIFFERTSSVCWNHKKLLVIQYEQWEGDGTSYPEKTTEEKIYDVESGIVLKQADILKPNYKAIVLKSLKSLSEFEIEYFKRESTSFAYMTHKGLMMAGIGTHGWQCNYFFIPLSEMKTALKEGFVKKYLKI